MGATWARFDVGIFHSPKYTVMRKRNGWRAMVAAAQGNLYATQHETNGFLAQDIIPEQFARQNEEDLLVNVGIWIPVPGGYEINGYADKQLLGNTPAKGQMAAAIRWSCERGHHAPKCRLPGCTCECHLPGGGTSA